VRDPCDLCHEDVPLVMILHGYWLCVECAEAALYVESLTPEERYLEEGTNDLYL
jgi:hypothetical protein